MQKNLLMLYAKYGKRIMDVCLSAIGLLVILPFLLLFTIVLYFLNDGLPFYLHERPGKNGRVFNLIKFKTMNDMRDEHGRLLPDEERLTSVGRLLRSFSIDEFPQLINVLKGDMSLIGPRPLLLRYLPLYNDRQIRRQEVRPGITGLAQVKGRNAISWQEKFEYDVWYVENVSFTLDIKILLLTILKVLKREGINDVNNRMTKPFTGDNAR